MHGARRWILEEHPDPITKYQHFLPAPYTRTIVIVTANKNIGIDDGNKVLFYFFLFFFLQFLLMI